MRTRPPCRRSAPPSTACRSRSSWQPPRMKLLSPAGLLERLRGRLDTLTARARDVPERQRTIRATIDWSYDLIGPPERSLFAQVSVFPGDFSVEAAEASAPPTIEPLEALVDSSLLHPAGEGRFRMLEIVRQRAAERLAEAGRRDAVGRRHLEFFLELGRGASADPARRRRRSLVRDRRARSPQLPRGAGLRARARSLRAPASARAGDPPALVPCVAI